jgi:hypothetical protein
MRLMRKPVAYGVKRRKFVCVPSTHKLALNSGESAHCCREAWAVSVRLSIAFPTSRCFRVRYAF